MPLNRLARAARAKSCATAEASERPSTAPLKASAADHPIPSTARAMTAEKISKSSFKPSSLADIEKSPHYSDESISLQPEPRLVTTAELSHQVSSHMIDSVSSSKGKHGTLLHGLSSIHGESTVRNRSLGIHGESSAQRSVTTDPCLASLCVKTDICRRSHVNARRQEMID